MKIETLLPDDWRDVLRDALDSPDFFNLSRFLEEEYRTQHVFPEPQHLFEAFRLTSYAATNVLLLGQDPYHDDGQAHGLAFSVRKGTKIPPSLRNIFIELESDLGIPKPDHGFLESWARQGVLLLNTVLTVRAHQAGSHRGHGWESFTDAVIRSLAGRDRRMVFVFWGNSAQAKCRLVDSERHVVIASAHPSPLSARNGFFGSRPFSRINAALVDRRIPPVDWRIPPLQPGLFP